MKLIENNHMKLLSKAMDAYALRQKITSSNIANVDTPDYKKLSVSFEDELNKIGVQNLDETEINNLNPKIVEQSDQPVLEEEMLEMADTQIRVQMVTRALRHNFQTLRAGITGRNR